MFTALLILVFLVYAFLTLRVLLGLKQLTAVVSAENHHLRQYSVIIAAHNEEANISKCLEALANQNYPADRYEVIVAADRCTDRTVQIAKSFKNQVANLRIVQVAGTPDRVSPKKFALLQSIREAQFEHLLFLDADVAPALRHIRTMNRYFRDDTAAVVSLMRFRQPKTFWQGFLVFEKLISWCIAGAGVGFQRPIISYGGNWGYTKTAFQKAGGFDKIQYSLGGDDDLLLQQMGALHLPVSFCLEPDGWVEMTPPESLQHFFRQRRRHFSAGKNYRGSVQTGYFLYHFSNLILWMGGFFYWPFFAALFLKIMLDRWILRKGQHVFQIEIPVPAFLIFDFLYLIYNAIVGPLGHIGKIRW